MMKRLVVVGVGAHGRELASLARSVGWELAGVTSDEEDTGGDPCWPEVRWLGRNAWQAPVLAGLHYVIGVGMPRDRLQLAHRLAEVDGHCVTLHSDLAWIDADVRFGPSTVVQVGCVVAAGTRIGPHSHLGLGTVLGADCRIGEFVTIGPGVTVSAGVTIGDLAFIGAGSTIAPGCSVGCSSTVSAGSVVAEDIPDGVTARGVPARWDVRTEMGGAA